MKYYFVGIKGSGMSALAMIIKDLGNEVVGADTDKEMFTQHELIKKEIKIESLNNMNYEDSDLIVVGNAFLDKYDFKNKETITYQELLSFVSNKYYSIAVCGTHGKTTITNMIKHVLSGVYKTAYLVGDGHGKASYDAKYFVFEACEHKDHFLSYFPNMIVCDNVDYDHVEYFKNKRQYKKSFEKFFSRAKDVLIINNKINSKTNSIKYGKSKADINYCNEEFTSEGVTFDLVIDNQKHERLFLPFFGSHMLNNALACITCCYYLKIDIPTIIKSLQTYKSASRRYNKIVVNDNVIIDDYGHHPNEIKQTIKAIKQEYGNKDLIIFYHPDRPKRLIAFLYKYQSVFKSAKKTYVMPFINEGKEEENAILTLIDNKNILRYDQNLLNKKYTNTVFLFTGSKEMGLLINTLTNKL